MEADYKFEKLTPVSDSDIRVYESAIDFVFKEDDVKNVAISGAYGAGKSSVLESYKKKHKKLKFIHISLAHFQSQDSPEDTKIKNSILEGKILNQLIHQISSDRIPQTNFRVKKTISPISVFINAFAIALLLLALSLTINFSRWSEYVATVPCKQFREILSVTTSVYAPLVGGIVIFAVLSFFVYKIVKMQKNKNIFRKLSWQGNEIEIFEETDDSYFDKYLNEVLYLFENVDADVIVFEDMDRFEANGIFERLREINTLVNQPRKGGRKKVLRFFYLLRDDIFISKDRTKFFDCIIPVVPIVDGSNSYNQFISHLKKNQLFEKFDEGFLQGISLYVDDMRLLKNICNEFLIYYNRLNTTELDYNKMLAIIVYKNLFPRDFCDLQLGKGFVYTLFASKDQFIADQEAEIKREIALKKDAIDALNKESLESVQELNDVYEKKRARITPQYGSQRNREIKEVDDWYKNVYPRRKQAIEHKNANMLHQLEQELQALEHNLAKLKNSPLHTIVTRENIGHIFAINTIDEIGRVNQHLEIKGSEYFDLLKYLIRNGHIDASYADYMTYFYEDSLSRVDKIFLRSITDKKPKEYGYALKSPQLVLSRLKPVSFDQEETLNFDLTNYLLRSKDSFGCLTHLIQQLKKTTNFSYIRQYFDVSTEKTAFAVHLNELWPEMFVSALTGAELSEAQLREYSVLTLTNSPPEVLKAVNVDGKLRNYISDSPDYMNIASPQVDTLITAFKHLGVSFHKLKFEVSDVNLFRRVYQEGLYDLTFENIKLMLQCAYGFSSLDDIQHQNYSLILTNLNSPLHQKVLSNMSDYVEILLENCGGVITDKEQTVRDILNSDQISIQQKERYIEVLSSPVSELNAITDRTVWGALIMCKSLIVTEKNILDFFLFKKNVDAAFIKFINRAQSGLDFSNMPQYSPVECEQLFDTIVTCNEIENSKYAEILATLGFRYDAFDVAGIADDKIRILIDCNIIKMNAATLSFLREHYKKIVLHYISRHINEYVALVNSKMFSQDELLAILSWQIDDTPKLALLEFSNEDISIIGKTYSLPIRCYILHNNLDENDMKILFCEYGSQEAEIKAIVLDYAKDNIPQLAAAACDADSNLILEILIDNDISMDDKINLVLALLPTLNQEEAQKHLSLLELNEFAKIFDTRLRPRYQINQTSSRILEAFRKKGWLYEYLEDEDKPGYYKIRRTQPKGKSHGK